LSSVLRPRQHSIGYMGDVGSAADEPASVCASQANPSFLPLFLPMLFSLPSPRFHDMICCELHGFRFCHRWTRVVHSRSCHGNMEREGRTAWGGRGEGRKDLPGRHIQKQVHNKIMRMYKLTWILCIAWHVCHMIYQWSDSNVLPLIDQLLFTVA